MPRQRGLVPQGVAWGVRSDWRLTIIRRKVDEWHIVAGDAASAADDRSLASDDVSALVQHLETRHKPRAVADRPHDLVPPTIAANDPSWPGIVQRTVQSDPVDEPPAGTQVALRVVGRWQPVLTRAEGPRPLRRLGGHSPAAKQYEPKEVDTPTSVAPRHEGGPAPTRQAGSGWGAHSMSRSSESPTYGPQNNPTVRRLPSRRSMTRNCALPIAADVIRMR